MKDGINTEIQAKEKYKQLLKKGTQKCKGKRVRNDNTKAISFYIGQS